MSSGKTRFRWIVGLVLLALWMGSCARAPLKGPENSLLRADAPELSDDLPLEQLFSAITEQVQFLEKSPRDSNFVFGEETFTKQEYLAGLRRFLELGKKHSGEEFFDQVRDEFDFYEVYGDPSPGDVFITSYFEPVIPGALKKTDQFSQPLYGAPNDILRLDLERFDEKFADERKRRARVVGNDVYPYYSREEIDSGGALSGKKLELCWVDPIDAFFLQVQGSGTVELSGGKSLRLIYAEKNGHQYHSIGKFLKEKIPADQLTLHSIERYLRGLPVAEMRKILYQNPSYVFFHLLEGDAKGALTYLGVPATAGRTIATDPKYFPKGALAFLVSTKPKFDSIESTTPSSWEPLARFVLDQDIGGAIVGGGRVDLFWGRGAEAKQYAGVMKQSGKLYYLAPKKRENMEQH
ncbi:MAG: MltA domain-containing protein [Bdellovibrionota bacterium]